jgi:hypothetical protein
MCAGIMMFIMIFSNMPALLPILGSGAYALLCFSFSLFGNSLTVLIDSFDIKEKVG